MFVKKLDLDKRELNILTVATGILIIGILAVISLMQPSLNDEKTDIRFLGYQFTRLEESILVAAPVDEVPFEIQVSEENEHDTLSIEGLIITAYTDWQRFLRNAIILVYVVFFLILILKKNETQFQGVFKGILIGSGFMLFLLTLQLGLDVSSGLVKFGHDFIHLVPLI